MLVSESITRIRRIIRDVNSKVFTDPVIVRIWNEMQMRFCLDSRMLETYTVLPVPPITHMTHTHRWEEEYISKPSNIIYNFMSTYTYTQPWEPAVILDLATDITGGYTSTQQWESFYVDLQNRICHYFPDDYIEATFIAYDNKDIPFVFPETVAHKNEAFKSKVGLYPSVYIEDIESNTFYLYPKVTAYYGIVDMGSDYGEIGYDEDDNINPSTDYGVITFATADDVDSDYGIVTYYQRPENALYLIYVKEPFEVSGVEQTITVPTWCVKYVEFLTMERLLKMESDLQDLTLSSHFKDRYTFSLHNIKNFLSRSKGMRVYGLEGGPLRRSGRKLADLPSAYPSLWA